MNNAPRPEELGPAHHAMQAFVRQYRRHPEVLFRAPGRVNCIGDHTDYQGGWSLPIALTLATHVALAWRADDQVRAGSDLGNAKFSSTLSELAQSARRAAGGTALEGLSGFIAAAVDLLAVDRGFDLWVTSDLPVGSGLSSSAALSLGLLSALSSPSGLPQPELIRLAQAMENRYLGVNSGILDQTAIAYARADHAVFIDAQAGTASPIPFDFAAAGYRLWIIDTRTPRSLAHSAYDRRVAETRQASQDLGLPNLRAAAADDWQRLADPVLRKRARHVITENQRVWQTVELAASGRWDRVASLLTNSHRSLRDDFEVSTPALDAVVDLVDGLNPLLSEGFAGARLTGAGFGGSVIALFPGSAETRLRSALGDVAAALPGPPAIIPIARPEDGLRQAK